MNLFFKKIVCLSVMLSGGVCGMMEAAPVVRASRVEVAPDIDGKIEEAVWQKAIVVSDFLVPDSHRPLKEKTEVRLLWDANKLYISARLEESTLSTASQQQHEIKAAAEQRDEDVIKDDSFLFILHPEASEHAYEFAINTRGVVADAKSDPENLWSVRDFSWDGKVDAVAVEEDGFWTVEMAIPWSDLGVEAPANGAQWKVVIGRHAAARRESGAWNPSHGGIHAPKEWGGLIFGETVPGIQTTTAASTLESGENQMKVLLTPAFEEERGVFISTKLTPEGEKAQPVRSRKVVRMPAETATSHLHEFVVKDMGGSVYFSWSAIDAATLDVLYQSPEINMEVLSSSIKLRLSTDAGWKFFVNDALITSGEKADQETIKVPLRTGANVLALEVASGSANIHLDSSDLGNAPVRWKMRHATDASALQASVDDSQWETAPENEDGAIGKPGEKRVLRHTILFQDTRIFPAPHPALYIVGDGVQLVTFTAFGATGKTFHNWRTWLEVPESVTAIGATGYYGKTRESKPQFTLRPDGEHRYVVEADAAITARKGGNPILSIYDVALRQNESAVASEEETYTMQYYSRANDDTVSEFTQNVPVRLLPPLKGVQFKKLSYQIWSGFFAVIDNPEIRIALAETMQAAGFNDLVGSFEEDENTFSLKTTLLMKFVSWSLDLAPWLRENPDARLVDQKGEANHTLMCMSTLLESGWKEAGAPLLKQWWEKRKLDTINYDYEYPPFNGPHTCYCERCLSAFRTAAGISAEENLTPEIIVQTYSSQWVDFMARRVAQLFRLIKDTVNEFPGDIKFEVYSGYHTPENAARYGVDWRYVGEMQAADRVGMGYGRPIPAIHESIKVLKGIPAMFGELITPYMKEPMDFSRPTNQATKANLLRRFIDSTGGVLIYHTQNMDGRSWYAAAEISRLVAQFEDVFEGQKAVSLPEHSEAEVALLKGEDVALLCVMNPGRTEKSYSIKYPEELGEGKEFYSDRVIKAGKALNVTLPAGEIAVYVINKTIQ